MGGSSVLACNKRSGRKEHQIVRDIISLESSGPSRQMQSQPSESLDGASEDMEVQPSNSEERGAPILEEAALDAADVHSSIIFRCSCKYVEKPIIRKELDSSESGKQINPPERLEVDNVMSSENISPGFARRVPAMSQPSALVKQVASKIIKHAQDIKYPNEDRMWCLNCGLFPMLPVTGQCGHTRCTICIQQNGACPCGFKAPESLHVNILIQDLMAKMLPSESSPATCFSEVQNTADQFQAPSTSIGGCQEWLQGPERLRRQSRKVHYSSGPGDAKIATLCRQPLSPQVRYKYARDLLASGRYREAAPHLAHAAASSHPVARCAKLWLAQAISVLSESRDPRRIERDLYRSVRETAASAWLRPEDVECVICYQVMHQPTTTPCGHTFCRACIQRTLYYRKRCALCSRSLDTFNIAQTADTSFVSTVLEGIDTFVPPSSSESDFIPIFACMVAFPAVSCPLLIFATPFWAMIRRVLDSGSRKFGMVSYQRDGAYSNYGTIVEVCDCVHFEDGRSILSTVGLTRFRVIERIFRDGCQMARIEQLTDIIPTDDLVVSDIQILAQQIAFRAAMWLSTFNKRLLSEIAGAFGEIPHFDLEDDWWANPNGPYWLWWLIALLPLKSEIQVLMLSTKHLKKRMMAVSRTLEVMDQEAVTPACVIESEIYRVYQNNQPRGDED